MWVPVFGDALVSNAQSEASRKAADDHSTAEPRDRGQELQAVFLSTAPGTAILTRGLNPTTESKHLEQP